MRFALFAALFLTIFIPTLTDLGYWPLDAETFIYGVISLVLAGLFTLIGRFHPSVDRFLIGLLVYWIADGFFFDTRPNAASNADRILDFSVADDTIHLSRSAFSVLNAGDLLIVLE